MPAIKT